MRSVRAEGKVAVGGIKIRREVEVAARFLGDHRRVNDRKNNIARALPAIRTIY
jgi:hypothetical protein